MAKLIDEAIHYSLIDRLAAKLHLAGVKAADVQRLSQGRGTHPIENQVFNGLRTLELVGDKIDATLKRLAGQL